ncbi:MAG: DPP IV N-terminal domain-containing protein [Planctomycetota bacterium]|jgi:Tol biopolymer transport system component
MKNRITKLAAVAAIAVAVLLPLSYGATKLIKRFIAISQLSAIKPNFVYGAALSPDGSYFAGTTIQSQLVVINTSTGEQRHLAENCYGPIVWSADGSEIAVVGYGKEKQTLLAVSLKTGKTRTLMEEPPWLADWSPDGKLILGRRKDASGFHSAVMVNLENKEEIVLAEDPGTWPSPRFSPNGDWVSYVTKEAGRSVLHLRKINGTSHVKYTDFQGEIRQPIWSPDGTHVVFTGAQEGINRQHADLWALRVEGNQFVGAAFPVVPDVEQLEFYNWSRNGQLAYRTGFRLGGMFILPVDLQTGKVTGTARLLVRGGGLPSLCWSPDGKQIAVQQIGGELTFISANTGEKKRNLSLPEIEFAARGDMSWSPDGRLIAFGGRDTEKRTGVFLITVKTGEVKLLVPLERVWASPTWSPDSRTIAYGSKSNVYIVNIEDGKPRRITAREEEEHRGAGNPVFAPDGRSVAYIAGQRRILATTIDGKETREIFHLKNDTFSIDIFDWSPDGRHIVFTPGNREIWCVGTDGGEPFQIADLPDPGDEVRSWLPKWSPTGEAICFNVYREKYQYWVMENFLPAE